METYKNEEVEIKITNIHGRTFIPVVQEGFTWQTGGNSSAGRVNINFWNDDKLNIQEGSVLNLSKGGKPFFRGYLFKRNKNREGWVSCLFYDQMRYLTKNKGVYVFENVTATQVITRIAEDFNVKLGSIAPTKHVIKTRIEDNQNLIDIILKALETTEDYTGEKFVLYDNVGKLTLAKAGDLKINYLADADTVRDFSTEVSIDDGVYNQVYFTREDSKEKKKREVYKAENKKLQERWGVLSHVGSLEEKEAGQARANQFLKNNSLGKNTLRLSGAIGHVDVRDGVSIYAKLDEQDIQYDDWARVADCSHRFYTNEHTMDMRLYGGYYRE